MEYHAVAVAKNGRPWLRTPLTTLNNANRHAESMARTYRDISHVNVCDTFGAVIATIQPATPREDYAALMRGPWGNPAKTAYRHARPVRKK